MIDGFGFGLATQTGGAVIGVSAMQPQAGARMVRGEREELEAQMKSLGALLKGEATEAQKRGWLCRLVQVVKTLARLNVEEKHRGLLNRHLASGDGEGIQRQGARLARLRELEIPFPIIEDVDLDAICAAPGEVAIGDQVFPSRQLRGLGGWFDKLCDKVVDVVINKGVGYLSGKIDDWLSDDAAATGSGGGTTTPPPPPPDARAQAFCAANPAQCYWNGHYTVPASASAVDVWEQQLRQQQAAADKKLPAWALPVGIGAGVLVLAAVVLR